MIGCYKGHFKIAKYLIYIGADVNRKSVKGNTALNDCAESGSLEIMKLLINSGARIDVDAYGMTPLLAASVTGIHQNHTIGHGQGAHQVRVSTKYNEIGQKSKKMGKN